MVKQLVKCENAWPALAPVTDSLTLNPLHHKDNPVQPPSARKPNDRLFAPAQSEKVHRETAPQERL